MLRVCCCPFAQVEDFLATPREQETTTPRHLICFFGGRSHASICIYDDTRMRTQLLCYNVGPQDSWYGAAPMIQIAILEAVVTDKHHDDK